MNLHDQILAEIERLTALAEAATPWVAYPDDARPFEVRYGDFGPGIVGTPMGEWEDSEQGRRDAEFARSVANPATVLRGLAEDRDILRRHPSESPGHCWDPYHDRPAYHGRHCPEVLSLARRHGIEVQL